MNQPFQIYIRDAIWGAYSTFVFEPWRFVLVHPNSPKNETTRPSPMNCVEAPVLCPSPTESHIPTGKFHLLGVWLLMPRSTCWRDLAKQQLAYQECYLGNSAAITRCPVLASEEIWRRTVTTWMPWNFCLARYRRSRGASSSACNYQKFCQRLAGTGMKSSDVCMRGICVKQLIPNEYCFKIPLLFSFGLH